MRFGTKIITLLFLSLCLVPLAESATYNASSCAVVDITIAMNSATTGDTVTVPSGSCNWSGSAPTMKSVALKGNGVDKTIITDPGFSIAVNNWTVTGFTFQYSATATAFNIGTNPSTGWAINGNSFLGYPAGMVMITGSASGTPSGVFSNNFVTCGNNSDALIYVNGDFGGGSSLWANPSYFGQAGHFVFIEDNEFQCAATSTSCAHAVMSQWGGSYVFRCNLVDDQTDTQSTSWQNPVDAHNYGLGSSTPGSTMMRASKEVEIYGNKFIPRGLAPNGDYPFDAIWIRGGSARIFNNVWDETSSSFRYYSGGAIFFREYRASTAGTYMQYPSNTTNCASTSSGFCTDTNGVCCSIHEGYPCCDEIGRGQDGYAGGRQQSIPVYLWNNKTTTGNNVTVAQDTSTTYETTVLQAGRDYIVNAGEPNGYIPYTYPHPSRNLGAATTCLADSNSAAKTGILFTTVGRLGAPILH